MLFCKRLFWSRLSGLTKIHLCVGLFAKFTPIYPYLLHQVTLQAKHLLVTTSTNISIMSAVSHKQSSHGRESRPSTFYPHSYSSKPTKGKSYYPIHNQSTTPNPKIKISDKSSMYRNDAHAEPKNLNLKRRQST